ncbi:MAG: methyltransferase domain-containing protein, partial [Proteobacteria bacterium]|nr:methyltransferase domain-containing protein [Pseudomonadota bacterium]
SNVEFRLGEIENLPVADCEVDVIISNCVINLSPHKQRVYAEMLRVLKPGGRLAISDIVALRELPEEMQRDLTMVAACVGGAQQVGGIESVLQELGFTDIRVEPMDSARETIATWFPDRGIEYYVASASITARKPETSCCG